MVRELEYHLGVNRATVAVFAALLLSAVALQAQIPVGVPSSVTSIGTNGQARGVPSSVTSLRPAPGTNALFPTPGFVPVKPVQPQHHRHTGYYGGTYLAPYAVPVPVEAYDDSNPQDAENGGPTIFDRRGPGLPLSHDTASAPPAVAEADAEPAPASEPVGNQTPTVLVFKDGHEMEIANYAIVGSTLYDLTDGHRRKIALAELDLPATTKENDNRGVDFQVPGSAISN
jgi:hypothetical protein